MTSSSSSVSNLDDATHPSSLRLTGLTWFPAASARSTSKTNRPYSEFSSCSDIYRDTSINVFRRWLKKDGTEIDASEVVSKACFDDWCTGRSDYLSTGLSRAFQSVLTAHIAGSGCRQPFQHDEEAAILKVIRKKQIWPAFKGTELKTGCRGYRGHGYHEKQQAFNSSSNDSPMQRQQVAARCAVDPTLSKPNHTATKARAKRRAAKMVLPQNKIFKQAEREYPSIPQQFWMQTPNEHRTASIHGEPYDVILQSQFTFSSLLGTHNQPLVVPHGYFKPMTFHLSHVLGEQTIDRFAVDKGQPNG